MRHGTTYSYDQGCHCAVCSKAKMDARQKQREKAKTENSPAYQRALAAARDRKEHHRGTCERCGGPTSWAGGNGKPKLCITCSREERAPKHGTSGRYNKGCHCDLCRAAHNERMRNYYAARKARAS